MQEYIDQTGNRIFLNKPPGKIISLVPSQTELLFDLGLSEKIAAITKFCIRPDIVFRSKQRVGGTKTINIKLIDEINPDLIIANKEENEKEQIEQLKEKHRVWISDIANLYDAIKMINTIGNLTDTTEKANEISDKIKHEFMKLEALIKPKELKSAAYVIWNKPLMVAGKNTFIDDILFRCKLTNVFNKQRYPETSMDELTELSPEVILLSSEPFPFKQKHLELFKENCKNSKILLVDGEMFSWYGSRLQYAPEYFKKILATIH